MVGSRECRVYMMAGIADTNPGLEKISDRDLARARQGRF
jgi:hypothetical protein